MSHLQLAFITHYTALYGANRSLLDLVRGLRSHGVESRVLCPGRGELLKALEREGVEAKTVGFRRWRTQHRWKAPLRLATNLAVMPAIMRQMRAWQPDVIYTNSSLVPVGAWAAAALGIPHVWHLREFGREDYGLKHDFGRSFFSYWLRRSAAVLAVSDALRRRVAAELGLEIHVVYNGVVTREEARALRDMNPGPEPSGSDGGRDARAEGSYLFAIVGTLGGRKGQGEAIDALARARADGEDVRLWVVGSGPGGEEARLRERAKDREVEEFVEFLGYVEDPFDVYRAVDAVLVCSRSEAMGRVTAEAMFACRPVIGYRGGATPELLTHRESGLLYEGGADELAKCMSHLARNPEIGREMGRQGWTRAYPELTVEVYADRVHGILRAALEESGSVPGS